jgi:N-acetylmuramoyl-L-alanine amidase
MKSAFPVFALTAALLVAPPAARGFGQPRYSGNVYVSLDQWARANAFSVRWLDGGKTLQLSKPPARLVFTVNSCDAEINGVGVRLSFPVAPQNGGVAITQLDLAKAIGPVLAPPANPPGQKIKTICLDPGHGGRDSGEHIGSVQEKKYTLLLAQELRDQLTAAGFTVFLTRTADSYVELSDRTELARRRRADLFVCLHFNSSPVAAAEVKGVETYCLTPAGANSSNAHGQRGDTRWLAANRNDEKNLLLAYEVQKSLLRELAVEDREIKRARFQVLREAVMPAILIEGGFLSHPVEGRRIIDPGYRRRLARAIMDGILAYKKIVRG